MYVCICKQVTENQIRRAVREGRVSHLRHLRQESGACTDCGLCCREASQLIHDTLEEMASLGACRRAA